MIRERRSTENGGKPILTPSEFAIDCTGAHSRRSSA